MPDDSRRELADRLLAHLGAAYPFAWCDDCLARHFLVSVEEIRGAAPALTVPAGPVEQRRRACYGCGRVVLILCLP